MVRLEDRLRQTDDAKFHLQDSLCSTELRVVSTYDAKFRSPDDVVEDDASLFHSPLRVFSMNEAQFSMDLAVLPDEPSKFQPRKEKSLSSHPHFQTNQLVCLRDQAVLSTTFFAFQP